MTKAFYERPEFLDLRDEWYAKLKEEGFDDIEVIDEITRQPGHLLRGVSPGDLNRSESRKFYKASSEEYYRLARQYVWTLPRGAQRQAARLHADGLSNRDVIAAMAVAHPEVGEKQVLKWISEARKTIRSTARNGQDSVKRRRKRKNG